METQTRDVFLRDELTIKSINFLRNNKRTRPTFAKIYKKHKNIPKRIYQEIFFTNTSPLCQRGKLICDKNSKPDKESYVINIQTEN